MSFSNVLELFSGIALFLFGMTLMSDGLKKVAGNSLEVILYKLSSNIVKAIFFGTGITAAIQSSSATSVMVVGFVNSKMMKVKQAIGVVMGAIIGTSITGWIIALSSIEGNGSGIFEILSTDTLTAVIAIIGIYLRMFCKHTKQKNLGDVLMGFAVLMFGMQTMSGSVSGLRNSPAFINALTSFSNPFIGILVGAIFTAVIQSASAAVGILQALSSTGAITFSVALPMLLGIGVGASLPVLISALGASRDGKRAAFSYLLVDVLGAIIISILFYGASTFVTFSFVDVSLNPFDIAAINTLYRVLFIVILIPFVSLIEKITDLCIKKDEDEDEDDYEEDRLEERFVDHPALAIEQCRLTINSMSDHVRDNLTRACNLLFHYDEKVFNKISKKEDVIDRYTDKLGTYIIKITRKELNRQQNEEVSKYLHAITDFERIADHAMNIAESAKSLNESQAKFTDSGRDEMHTLAIAIQDVVTLTSLAFSNCDLNLAYEIDPYEEMIDDICQKMKANHIERLKNGECTIEDGIVFNDLTTDIERIGDHCSNIAISMIKLENDSLETHKFEESLTPEQKANRDELLDSFKNKYEI